MFDFLKEDKFPLFFAGGSDKATDEHLEKNNCLRLLSYVNDKGAIIKRSNKGLKTFMDSGAFSAMTRGIEINVDEYIDFINTHTHNLHLFAQFDTIPFGDITPEESAKLSLENYLYMRERVLEPDKLVYAFHYGEDYKYLEDILNNDELDIKYIALGGVARKRTNIRIDFFTKAFEVIKKTKRPNVHVHGYGVTSMTLLEDFPFTSADSTSWSYSRYGMINANSKWQVISNRRKTQKGHFNFSSEENQEISIKEIKSYGYDIEDIRENTKTRSLYNIDTFIKWSKSHKLDNIK